MRWLIECAPSAMFCRLGPDWVKTFVLKERDGKTIVGVSMWTDEAAYKSPMASMQAPAQNTPPDRLRKSPPTMREFFEI